MERTVSATEARIHLGELMRDVGSGRQRVIIERSGRPQVVLLSIAEYQRLKQIAAGQATHWRDLAARSRRQVASELGALELPPSEEVIREIRDERDASRDDLH